MMEVIVDRSEEVDYIKKEFEKIIYKHLITGSSIDDLKQSLNSFLKEGYELKYDIRIINRKWWQVWKPRQWIVAHYNGIQRIIG